MFGLGFSEIVVLAVLGLILLGPEQLPDMARTLGRFINDLKRTTDGLQEEFKKQGFTDSQKFLDELRQETKIEPPNFDSHPAPTDLHPAAAPIEDSQKIATNDNAFNSTEVKDNELGKKPKPD